MSSDDSGVFSINYTNPLDKSFTTIQVDSAGVVNFTHLDANSTSYDYSSDGDSFVISTLTLDVTTGKLKATNITATTDLTSAIAYFEKSNETGLIGTFGCPVFGIKLKLKSNLKCQEDVATAASTKAATDAANVANAAAIAAAEAVAAAEAATANATNTTSVVDIACRPRI